MLGYCDKCRNYTFLTVNNVCEKCNKIHFGVDDEDKTDFELSTKDMYLNR